ncbi:Bug family tripartite tricarboxylate transporter substrate binding protein [Fodinicurvata halophila]|uniref:Bug family tripartite tricarboxylate transporter substrate binding protein n=1 Tax=Fodinicurvata halophila TaxID=1419723 RepID=A0ABV8UGG6_9PROT
MISRTLITAGILGLTAAPLAQAQADDYPSEPIKIVVPFAAGDALDQSARVIADQMEDELDVSVVIQNIAGAGGAVGTAEAVQAEPDGYTLLMGSTGALTARPLMADSGYKTDDFQPLAQLVEVPIGLAVAKDSEWEDVDQLFAAAEDERITYSTPGPGTTQHINMGQFALENGLNLSHIGGKGGTGAVTNVLTGEVDFVFVGATNYLGHLDGEDDEGLRVLGVGSEERVDYLPDTPTFQEAGHDLTAAVWFGLLTHSEVPEERVAFLEELISKVAQSEETRDAYAKFNLQDSFLDADAFQERIDGNVELHRQILTDMGVLEN